MTFMPFLQLSYKTQQTTTLEWEFQNQLVEVSASILEYWWKNKTKTRAAGWCLPSNFERARFSNCTSCTRPSTPVHSSKAALRYSKPVSKAWMDQALGRFGSGGMWQLQMAWAGPVTGCSLGNWWAGVPPSRAHVFSEWQKCDVDRIYVNSKEKQIQALH